MAAKKSAGKKKSPAKKITAKTKATEAKKKAKVAASQSVSLGQLLSAIAKNAHDAAAAGEVVGACLVKDPFTGTNSCVIVDAKTCKALKGNFIGGPCGA